MNNEYVNKLTAKPKIRWRNPKSMPFGHLVLFTDGLTIRNGIRRQSNLIFYYVMNSELEPEILTIELDRITYWAASTVNSFGI